jgi:hypothetical protein
MGFSIVYLNVLRDFFSNMVHTPAHEFFRIFPAHEFQSKNKQVPFFKRGAHLHQLTRILWNFNCTRVLFKEQVL